MTKGSYDFDSLHDPGFQVERLRQQAAVVRQLEADILRSAGLQADHNILEIGSGPGHNTALLAELAPKGALHAVEPSATLAAQISENVGQQPQGGLVVHQTTGDKLPLDAASVDFAYARFVLQHIPEPAPVLSEANRVLRPGGQICLVDSDDGLIICHPEQHQLTTLIETARSAQAAQGGDRFIGRKLQAMLVAAGFRDVNSRILTLTSTELPFSVLFNILLGYKASLLGGSIDLAALHGALAKSVAAGEQLIAGGVFIVTAKKP